MTTRWAEDKVGSAKLEGELATGLHAFASLAASNARTLSPHRWRNSGRYRSGIRATTFLRGALHAGEPIRAGGFSPGSATIHSIVYSQDFIAHLLEVTGAQPHDIPIPIHGTPGIGPFLIVKHPGFTRKPHFVPGLLQAASQAGVTMRGKQIVP